MDINADFLQQSIAFLIKKTSLSGIKNENISNKHPLDLAHVTKAFDHLQEFAEELHKPIT